MKSNMYQPIQLKQNTTTLSVRNAIKGSPLRLAFLLIPLALACFALAPRAKAGSATWLASPVNGDWNTAANWTAGGPPNGPSDTATFATSSQTNVSLSASTEVDGISFSAGANAFTITANPTFALTISGAGIVNSSGISQNFVTAVDATGSNGGIQFFNSATAGNDTVITNNAPITTGGNSGETFFNNTSTAGSATITNNGANMVTCPSCGGGATLFAVSSTAGSATITNNAGQVSGAGSGGTAFINTSTAGNASITNKGGASPGAAGGITTFNGNLSSASNANITNDGATASSASGGTTSFTNATADNATITNNGGTVSGAGGGSTTFSESDGNNATIVANAGLVSGAGGGAILFPYFAGGGNMTLIANGGPGSGGTIQFSGGDGTDGETARIEVFGNGNLDISQRPILAGALTIGSIEGSGLVFLGALNLTAGTNNLSTTFSGVIQDGGIGGGTGGSLSKTGRGKLTLSAANTYTGGTTITKGTLLVTNRSGSATGTGSVQVNKGTLGGIGNVTGAVTVGTGTSSGAILLPGKSATNPGTLTINSALTFNSISTYECVLKRSTVKASKATALGVSINSGATFTFTDTGIGTLTTGTVFTVINNISANPISGTFSNLPNGSTFTNNGNNFQASYTGGNGNDLTLTVVP